MKWYVLYTFPRAEKRVAEKLSQLGVEVFLPLHYCPRKWSDRIKYVEMPLFSSYIFVYTTNDILWSLLKIFGVSRIVFSEGKPAIVRDSEIAEIKIFLEQSRGKECEFILNEHVKIAVGPFRNVSGTITKTQGDYLVLAIEQLGVMVRVKADQVLKN